MVQWNYDSPVRLVTQQDESPESTAGASSMRTSRYERNAFGRYRQPRSGTQFYARCSMCTGPHDLRCPLTFRDLRRRRSVDREVLQCNGDRALARGSCRGGLRESSNQSLHRNETLNFCPVTGAVVPCKPVGCWLSCMHYGDHSPREPTSRPHLRRRVRLPVSCLPAAACVGTRICVCGGVGGWPLRLCLLTYLVPLSRRVLILIFSNIGL